MLQLSNLARQIVPRGGIRTRFMSVINLSDGEAADKFQKINAKSVLYFTAQVRKETSIIVAYSLFDGHVANFVL